MPSRSTTAPSRRARGRGRRRRDRRPAAGPGGAAPPRSISAAAMPAIPHGRPDRRRADADLDSPARRSRRSASSAGCAPGFGDSPIPAGPQRDAPRRARRSAGPARPVVLIVMLVVGTLGPADVPAGRAVPDALRRGLPRAHRHRVPAGLALRPLARHLRVDPSAPGEVRRWPAGSCLWGEDDVSATSELGVPVRAAAVEPRRLDELAPAASRRGTPPHRDRHRDPDLRPADARPRLGRSPRRGLGALAVDEAGDQLVLGYDDGRIATLDLDRDRLTAAWMSGSSRSRSRPWITRSTHLLVANDGGRGRGGFHGSTEQRRSRRRDGHRRRWTSPVSPTSRRAAAEPRSSPRVDAVDRPGGRRHRRLAEMLETATPPITRPAWRTRRPARPSSSATRGVARLGRRSTRPSPTGALAGHPRSIELSGSRPPRTTAWPSSTRSDASRRHDDRARGRRARARLRHRDRRPEAVRHIRRTGRRPELRRHRDRRRRGEERARGPWVSTRCRVPVRGSRSTRPASRSTSSGSRRARARPRPWTVYVVEPHGECRLSPTPPAGRLRARRLGRSMSSRHYPAEDRQQLLVFDGAGESAAIETGSHAFAWRLPGVIAGALMAVLPLPARPDPVRASPRRGAGRAVRACSTGCSSCNRGSA